MDRYVVSETRGWKVVWRTLGVLLLVAGQAMAGPAASELLAVRASYAGEVVTISVRGNGPLYASAVESVESGPPRVLLDFRGVTAARGVPHAVPVGHGEVQRVRVALNSLTPRVTRVVVDLTRRLPFVIESAGDGHDEVRVTFGPASALRALAATDLAVALVPEPPAAAPAAALADAAPATTPVLPRLTAPASAAANAVVAMPALPAADPPAPAVVRAPAPGTGAARDLVAGRQVKIEGRGRPDGTFDAVEVVLRNLDRTVKVEGRVTGVRGDKGGLTIMGFDVAYDRATTFYRGSRAGASRAEIAAGTWLEVKGLRQGRTIVAERVRIKDAPESTEEIEAVIERVDKTGTLTVLGRQVRVPSSAAVVDERTGDGVDVSGLRRDDDEQAREPMRIGSRVIIGGRVESAWVERGNYDLDDTADRADQWVSRVQLLGSAQLTSSIEAYSKVALNRSALLQDASLVSRQDVEVQEAYVMAHRVGGSPFTVQVGRQRFRDTREWFFDEYMDAARVSAVFGAWSVEGAVADGVFAGPVAGRDRKDKRHQIASIARTLGGRGKVSGFLVRRDDRGPADDDPLWLGGTADAKSDGGSRLWALGAVRRGHRGATVLGGWAMDAGATFAMPDLTAQPSITVGFARASGDAVSGDGRDTTFRQTDLEDNSARFGGLRRLTYYGELFDPELSNLQVLTAGVGLRPARTVGVDIVWHTYVQSVLKDSIPSSAFDLDATEASGLLGHELDAAVTIRAGRFDIDLAGGLFLAGPGLADRPRVAFFWRPQVRLYF